MKKGNIWEKLLVLHGSYYLMTGLWALISLSTFTQAVGDFHVGNEYEVHSLSAMVVALGVVFVIAAQDVKRNKLVVLVAAMVAFALAAVEFVYLPGRGWSLHWVNLTENIVAGGLFGYLYSKLP